MFLCFLDLLDLMVLEAFPWIKFTVHQWINAFHSISTASQTLATVKPMMKLRSRDPRVVLAAALQEGFTDKHIAYIA